MQEESRRQTVGTDGKQVCRRGAWERDFSGHRRGIDDDKDCGLGRCGEKIIFSSYERHHADQLQSIIDRLNEFYDRFPGCRVRLCLTGSGASTAAELLGIPFVQEVTANAIALQSRYARVGTAIELGGQDAKMIFFREADENSVQSVADMRMNGSCAGGNRGFHR